MPTDVSEVPTEILHEQIVPAFVAMLDEAPLDSAADLEQLASALLLALEQPELPEAAASAVLGAIEARRDGRAAGVLAALAVVAVEPLATRARASAQRLAGEGIVSAAAAGLGMLAVEEAVRIEGPDAELLLALLRRPGARDVQPALLAIEHQDGGSVLVECVLMPPVPVADARELLQGVDGGSDPEPIAPAELAARVTTAARGAVDAGIALGYEAGPALPIVSRAITGDPAGLPRPEVVAPWEDDDEELVVDAAEDEKGFHGTMKLLLDELEQHARATHPPDGVVWEHGDFVASTMLEFKGGYGDGRLGRWTEADLAEYLLDYFPRKVTASRETVEAVSECAYAFLEFLDARGSLSGAPLEVLGEACEALRDEFLDRADDRSGWGPAKSMVMQMLAEGVDPLAPGAIDRWIADFNVRPRDDRDAIVGPALDRMAQGAVPRPSAGSHPPKQQRTQRRKARRNARKRNRRR